MIGGVLLTKRKILTLVSKTNTVQYFLVYFVLNAITNLEMKTNENLLSQVEKDWKIFLFLLVMDIIVYIQ